MSATDSSRGISQTGSVETSASCDCISLAYAQLRVPRLVLADLALAGLTGGRRSFTAHARQMLPGIWPPLCVLGAEHIPTGGPGVITVNHYNRPGFWSPWFPAVISAQITGEVHWVMTDAFTLRSHPLGGLYRWLSHLALSQVARVYGFSMMPPMPPMPGEEGLRAAAVQRLVQYVRGHPDALLGLAPEGGDQPGGVLSDPPEGFGRLALLLSRRGMLFYPVGVYDEAGCLCVRFGERYCLSVPVGPDRHAVDCLAREMVMCRIADCLPHRLRGRYQERCGL